MFTEFGGHFTFVGPYEPELMIITWEFSLTERHTYLAIDTRHGVAVSIAYLFTKKKCFINLFINRLLISGLDPKYEGLKLLKLWISE